MENEVKELIKSVEGLLKLINDGVLVRDISKDSDFRYYTNQSFRIVKTLSSVQDNLKAAQSKAEQAMSRLKPIDIEVRELNKT